MSEQDRVKWDERHREASGGDGPSPFVSSLDELLPRHGKALDVAAGTGRHALWLARRGLSVTAVDISPIALEVVARDAQAAGLQATCTTLALDLEREALPAGPWNVILCTNFLMRDVYRRLPTLLADFGVLAIAHPTLENLKRHARPSARVLLQPGELRSLVGSELRVLRYEESWFDGRHEARLVATNRQASPD